MKSSRVLVLSDHRQGQLTSATLKTISAACTLGPVILLTVGVGAQSAAEAGGRLSGVAEVRAIVPNQDADPCVLAEALAPLVVREAAGCSHILAPSGTFARDLLPRVAGLLSVSMVSDVIAIEDARTFQRFVLAGHVVARIQVTGQPICLTIRATSTAFPEVAPVSIQAPHRCFSPLSLSLATRLLAFCPSPPTCRPALEGARIVVVAGNGVVDAEGFRWVERLADRLGAALGATRGVVDAGLAPSDWQVGQTGKLIAPELYFGIGVSGAIQHLAGIKEAHTLVAINRDGAAPIFSVSDFGWVADLRQAVPELLDALG